MGSIYEIPNWSGGVTASKNDVYFYLNNHFYSLEGSNTETPSVGASKWGGMTTFDNKEVPHFFWIPSYSPTISTEPSVRTLKFGDGYEQRTPDGVNTNLLKISLNYDNRDEAESTAIAHFLNERGGAEAFVYLPPSPYSSMKKFICRKWDVTMNFDNNYSIKVDLEEVVE